MIPKKIHYCWFGGAKLPKNVKKCIKSWKKYCPDYEIIQWNETNFNTECIKFVKEAYKEKAWAFVSDYARLKIIYENGGIYLDTDVEIVKNIDELLSNDCYFAEHQNAKTVNTGLGFGAVKHNKIIKEMMNEYEKIVFDIEKKQNFICPILNTKILYRYGYIYNFNEIVTLDNLKIAIYPPKYFDPIAPGSENNLLCNETFSIHHYSASWTNKRYVLKRKIIRIIGQNKINKWKKYIRKIIKV